MAAQITQTERVFKLDNVQLPDPNPGMTVEEVKTYYAGIYPQTTNSKIMGPNIVDGKAEYTFHTQLGHKG